MTPMLAPVPPPFAGRTGYRFSPDQFRRLRDAGIVDDADEADVLAGRHRFTVDQYERIDGLGVLPSDDRVELLDGLLLRRPDINPPHATAVENTREMLRDLLPAGWTVRSQVPFALPASQPMPDVTVVRGTRGDYRARHPALPDLGIVIEVSDSTLSDDRRSKALLYAAAGVTEYWVVNVADRQVEVMTLPSPAGYGRTDVHPAGGTVPLRLDGSHVADVPVTDLLP